MSSTHSGSFPACSARVAGAAALLCTFATAISWAAEPAPVPGSLRYDTEYPTIPYSGPATHNAIAQLQGRIDRGEVKLEYHPTRGYLDSLLKALNISPASQVLVYSKTSLQISGIAPPTPRAVYFDDRTYVGFVLGAPLLELATVDSELGVVFYTMLNRTNVPRQFDREAGRCLTCHDTYSMMGGGVPRVVVMSAIVDGPDNPPGRETSDLVADHTPLRERWGGWYVTGQLGSQTHLGNMPIDGDPLLAGRSAEQRHNLQVLDGLFDTRPYLTNKSDVVALLVLEHQTSVENLITRANFKIRTVLARSATGGLAVPRSWEDISPRNLPALKAMLEPLVRTMLFVDAVDYASPIKGNSGFDAWFQAQGPRDAAGRSLRELDLNTRLFRYPLSYLVYSEAFDSLPEYARQYIYGRFAEILQGRDTSGAYADISAADGAAVLEILKATKPEFAQVLARDALASR